METSKLRKLGTFQGVWLSVIFMFLFFVSNPSKLVWKHFIQPSLIVIIAVVPKPNFLPESWKL